LFFYLQSVSGLSFVSATCFAGRVEGKQIFRYYSFLVVLGNGMIE